MISLWDLMIVYMAQQQDDIVKLYKNSDSNVSNKLLIENVYLALHV